jgi:hypothetical protein
MSTPVNGEVFGVVALEALALARQYADRWHAPVSGCRVPFVDEAP